MNYRYLSTVALASFATLFAAPAFAQLRVVTFNSANGTSGIASARAGMDEILKAMGDESRAGIAKPVDVLLLQEVFSQTTTTQSFVDLLNARYGAGTYARGTVNGATTGAGTQGIVYNTRTVSLIAETKFGSTSVIPREHLRYRLRPVGYGASADFYAYNGHYKAGSAGDDAVQRNDEAVLVRANADALGQGTNAIFVGDFNVQRSSEAMYQTFLAGGNAQAFDPANRPGNWNDGNTFRDIHTQSPATVTGFTGQTLGGMDSRFDIQLATGEMLDGEGVSYIANTYRTFGNTGNHALNGALNVTASGATNVGTAFAAFLPGYSTAQAQSVLNRLAQITDHLPVVADYQVPAKMGVSVSAAPGTVIVGANVSLIATVSNTADVVAANGADELDFAVSGTGAVSGGGTGTDDALGAGVNTSVSVNTSVAGAITGAVTVTSSSEAVANGTFSQNVAVNVLSHANPSFAPGADTNALTLNFGTLTQNSGAAQQGFSLANLVTTAGFTSRLDLDSILASGDTGVFGTNLATFGNLSAGSSSEFAATFATGTAGDFSATYTLGFSDENLPGAANLGTLALTLTGRVAPAVVPEAGTPTLLLGVVGLAVGGFVRRRGVKAITA